MTWKSADGHRYKRRANGWPYDSVCPDGFLSAGWRRVNRNGEVQFHRAMWTAPILKEYVGQVVRVEITDPFGCDCHVFAGAKGTTPDNIATENRHATFYDYENRHPLERLRDSGREAVFVAANQKRYAGLR